APDRSTLRPRAPGLLRRRTGAPDRSPPARAPRDGLSRVANVIWSWEFALDVLPDLLGAFVVTMEATVAGFAVAAVAGLGWALLRMVPVRPLARAAFLFVDFVRSTPLLIQIYFLYFVLPEYGVAL